MTTKSHDLYLERTFPGQGRQVAQMQEDAERNRALAGHATDFASYQKHVLGDRRPTTNQDRALPIHQ